MTQLIKTEIPASIGTVEQLSCWCMEVLSNLYPDQTSVEATDSDGVDITPRCAESNKFYITASDPNGWRYLARVSLPLRATHQQEGKLWQHVGILGDLAVPTPMKS